MKELPIIIQEGYESLPTMPGLYKNLDILLQNVNNALLEQGSEAIDMNFLCDFILKTNPKARIEMEYRLQSGEIIPAARIFFQKNFIPTIDETVRIELREKISSILLSSMPNEDGWFLKSQIMPKLLENGLNIKGFGFVSQQDAFEVIFGDDYKSENRGDDLHPKIYISCNVFKYVKEGTLPYKKELITTKVPSKNGTTRKKKASAFEKLMSFAVFPNGFNNAIKQLAEEKALKENWFYGDKNQDPGSYPILKNYLLLTFERLLAEDEEHSKDSTWEKKILVTDKNAVFNTGLVDKLYEPVYALFSRNNSETSSRKWIFWTFVKSNDREHQLLTRIFGTNLPTPAHYYNQTSELVYNIKTEIGSYNWDHFIDNCRRLPLDFLRENGPKFDYTQPKNAQFYKRLAEAIKADQRSMNRIKNRITDAIEYAIKRVRWNFKTAIPIYYPGQKQISLLLPLALVDEDNIDVALVLEATESGAYIAHTILTLEMAYTNARLITRPDSDWLTAEKISANPNLSAEYED